MSANQGSTEVTPKLYQEPGDIFVLTSEKPVFTTSKHVVTTHLMCCNMYLIVSSSYYHFMHVGCEGQAEVTQTLCVLVWWGRQAICCLLCAYDTLHLAHQIFWGHLFWGLLHAFMVLYSGFLRINCGLLGLHRGLLGLNCGLFGLYLAISPTYYWAQTE